MRLSLPLLLLLPPLAAPSQFKYITYTTLTTKLQDFATLYPTLATLQTTQEEYGLPTVLTCGSSLAPCLNYYLTITDAATSTSPTTSDPYQSPAYKPDVFFSGEVHGDETVGPLATLHTAELLVTAAGCAESHFENAAAPGESERSDSCRLWFQEWGFGTQELYWLAGLVGTRRIIISPMSNPSGFDKTGEERHQATKREGGFVHTCLCSRPLCSHSQPAQSSRSSANTACLLQSAPRTTSTPTATSPTT